MIASFKVNGLTFINVFLTNFQIESFPLKISKRIYHCVIDKKLIAKAGLFVSAKNAKIQVHFMIRQ